MDVEVWQLVLKLLSLRDDDWSGVQSPAGLLPQQRGKALVFNFSCIHMYG